MQKCPDCLLLSEDDVLRCGCGHAFESAVEDGSHERLEQTGARWFYWIAGLSMLNSVIALFGAQVQFLIGLGTTQLVHVWFGGFFGVAMPNLGYDPRLLPALGIELLLALSLAALGWAAFRGLGAAFLVGIAIYALDTVLYVAMAHVPSVLLHLLALFFLLKGYLALRANQRDSDPESPGLGPAAQRWRLVFATVLASVLFTPFLVFGVATMFSDSDAAIQEEVFARAPESFTSQERRRLESAFEAAAARFDDSAGADPEATQQMNAAVMGIVLKPPGETASREEMLELTRWVEAVAETSPAGVRSKARKSSETPTVGAEVETGDFHFFRPEAWDVEQVFNHFVSLRLEDGAAMELRVERRGPSPLERVRWQRFAEGFHLTSCEKDSEVSSWGDYEGHGWTYDCLRYSTPLRAKVFATRLADGRHFEFRSVFGPDEESSVVEAEALIQETLGIDG